MLRPFYGKIYPFISVGFLQVGQWLETAQWFTDLLIFLIQIMIGILTIWKLYTELFKKKTEKQSERQEKRSKLIKFFEGVKNVFKSIKK